MGITLPPSSPTPDMPPVAGDIGPADRAARASDRQVRVWGTVRVAPAVLLETIEMTVSRVEGVAALESWRNVERQSDRTTDPETTTLAALTFEAGGVRVRLRGIDIEADVSVKLRPGASVAIVSRTLRRDVGVAVNQMLGLSVTVVNVFVAGINDPSEG